MGWFYTHGTEGRAPGTLRINKYNTRSTIPQTARRAVAVAVAIAVCFVMVRSCWWALGRLWGCLGDVLGATLKLGCI